VVAYVDSSAVLAVLLQEERAEDVRCAMRAASTVVTSALTAVECSRALIHAQKVGRIDDDAERSLQASLAEADAEWSVYSLSARVLARARAPMPANPIRTLDALHIATVLTLRESFSDLTVVSLDNRMRDCVAALGLPILPASL
jgi:uncharacterized protein